MSEAARHELRVGIIGFGNMGFAIAERVKASYKLVVFDKDSAKTAAADGFEAAGSIKNLIEKAEVLILAVKPQDFDGLLEELSVNIKKQLVISIAAGITTAYIEKRLENARVIRVMPNMPAQIGHGVSGLCKGKYSNEQDFSLALDLMSRIGLAIVFDNEDWINKITAVSGSGPAFYCHYFKAGKEDEFADDLTQSAINIDFDSILARSIAEKTRDGTQRLLMEKGWTCEELTKRVASKGGTTEAGLEELRRGGSLDDAVKAALKRAKELSKD